MAKRFDRDGLPDPVSGFEAEGLTLKGPGLWKTTACNFHGGSDSMRVNTESGAWKCMNCGEAGGDILAYVMKLHGWEFMEAAERLGAAVDGSFVAGTVKLAICREGPHPLQSCHSRESNTSALVNES